MFDHTAIGVDEEVYEEELTSRSTREIGKLADYSVFLNEVKNGNSRSSHSNRNQNKKFTEKYRILDQIA